VAKGERRRGREGKGWLKKDAVRGKLLFPGTRKLRIKGSSKSQTAEYIRHNKEKVRVQAKEKSEETHSSLRGEKKGGPRRESGDETLITLGREGEKKR